MSERPTKPCARAEQTPANIEWPRLMNEALNMPGAMGSTYQRFANYSFGNQVLLFMQGVEEPVNTFKRWGDMGRQVKRGSKAKHILRPIIRKELNDLGVEEESVKGFKLVNCLFTVSETEGDDLPEYEPPTWSKELALGNLAIVQIAFDQINGNTQGFSRGRELAINPVAGYPFKTLHHELGHIVLGHTSETGMEEYRRHRGLMEFQAESTAYLAMNELDATDQFDAAESRAYIRSWLRDEQPEDAAIKQVFSATDRILKAGRDE